MNAPELLAGFNRRSNIRGLDVVGATAALVVIVTAAVLLATFEAAAWEMKALARTLAPGKIHAAGKRLDRHASYDAHSQRRWRA